MKIAFDIGGVLSKHVEFVKLLWAMQDSRDYCFPSLNHFEIFICSDMHDREKTHKMLLMNGIHVDDDHLLLSDYEKYGERCKEVLLKQHGIDIFFDDFVGYVNAGGAKVNLLVWPDKTQPYYADTWRTDGSEGDFGRRKVLPGELNNE